MTNEALVAEARKMGVNNMKFRIYDIDWDTSEAPEWIQEEFGIDSES